MNAYFGLPSATIDAAAETEMLRATDICFPTLRFLKFFIFSYTKSNALHYFAWNARAFNRRSISPDEA